MRGRVLSAPAPVSLLALAQFLSQWLLLDLTGSKSVTGLARLCDGTFVRVGGSGDGSCDGAGTSDSCRRD